MKNKILGFLPLLIAVTFQTASAQNGELHQKGLTYIIRLNSQQNFYPDSIRVEFPEQKALVVFEIKNVHKNESVIEHFGDSLRLWVSLIEKGTSNLSSHHRVDVNIQERKATQITIVEQQDKVTHLAIQKEAATELLPPGWEMFVQQNDYKVYVYAQTFEGLSQLSKQSFTPASEKVKAEQVLEELGRKSMKSRIIVKEGAVAFSETKRKIAKDLIVGRASAGLGLLGDKFYPELNAMISLRFGDRFNRANNEITFTYNNMFLMDRASDGSYQMGTNSFINVGWRKNLAHKGDPSWFGLGAGYLISNHGNYFKGNTMKFFIDKSIAPGVSISPELYLTDDFKKGIMGIKINFTF